MDVTPRPQPPADPPESDEEYYARARKYALEVVSHGGWRSRTGSYWGDDEDLVQEVMHRLIFQEKRPRNLEAWLNTVLRNYAIDRWRAGQARPIETEFEEPDAQVAVRDFFLPKWVGASGEAMQALSEAALHTYLRTKFSEREIELANLVSRGYSDAEIANRMNYANANSVKTTKNRIRRKARRLNNRKIARLLNHPHIY